MTSEIIAQFISDDLSPNETLSFDLVDKNHENWVFISMTKRTRIVFQLMFTTTIF